MTFSQRKFFFFSRKNNISRNHHQIRFRFSVSVIVKIVVSKILIFIGYISSGLLNSTLGYNHLSMTRQVAAQSLTDNFNPAFSVAKPDEKGIMKPKLPFPYLYW